MFSSLSLYNFPNAFVARSKAPSAKSLGICILENVSGAKVAKAELALYKQTKRKKKASANWPAKESTMDQRQLTDALPSQVGAGASVSSSDKAIDTQSLFMITGLAECLC